MNSIFPLFRMASRLAVRPTKGPLSLSNLIPSNQQNMMPKRWGHNAPLTYDFARERILLVLRLYDKIDPEKLTLNSHFILDLGLNSLDHTEIIMMMEDEFNFEIPDRDSEKLLRPADILKYITDKEEAYEELQTLHAHSHHHHEDHDHKEHGIDQSHDHGTPSGHKINAGTTTQQRSFSSWSYNPKRFLASKYYTSFNEKPPKDVSIEDIQKRVMKVCSKYDKIDSSKLHTASHFVDDLGLDSLDHVEIMMELEDEFGLEIPDQEAEKLMRPAEIARYIFGREEARSLSVQDRPF